MKPKLQKNVLVLNKSMVALSAITAKKAFCILYRGHASIIDVYKKSFQFYDIKDWADISDYRKRNNILDDTYTFINSEDKVFIIPKVIRLMNYNEYPEFHVVLNRRNLYARDNNTCQYCGVRFPTQELSIEHIVPTSKGGKTKWDNVVCACVNCNVSKGNKSLKESGLKLLKRPGKPVRDPKIKSKVHREEYKCWKYFLDEAYWNVELEEE